MEANRIGFIGFAEVGRTFSQEMRARGAEVYYYDLVAKKPAPGIVPLPLNELVARCAILLSTVATHVAVAAAEAAAPYLTPRNTYADMNSTSASVKRRIAEIVTASKADFVGGAILSAVGEAGAGASILVGGERAQAFAQRMNQLGLINVKFFSPRIGEASQVKMLRSIFSKGVADTTERQVEAYVQKRVSELLTNMWRDLHQANDVIMHIERRTGRTNPHGDQLRSLITRVADLADEIIGL